MLVSIKAYADLLYCTKWSDDVFCDSRPEEMLGCETLVGVKSFGPKPVSISGHRKLLAQRCFFPHTIILEL